jgi:hypothetical protein
MADRRGVRQNPPPFDMQRPDEIKRGEQRIVAPGRVEDEGGEKALDDAMKLAVSGDRDRQGFRIGLCDHRLDGWLHSDQAVPTDLAVESFDRVFVRFVGGDERSKCVAEKAKRLARLDPQLGMALLLAAEGGREQLADDFAEHQERLVCQCLGEVQELGGKRGAPPALREVRGEEGGRDLALPDHLPQPVGMDQRASRRRDAKAVHIGEPCKQRVEIGDPRRLGGRAQPGEPRLPDERIDHEQRIKRREQVRRQIGQKRRFGSPARDGARRDADPLDHGQGGKDRLRLPKGRRRRLGDRQSLVAGGRRLDRGQKRRAPIGAGHSMQVEIARDAAAMLESGLLTFGVSLRMCRIDVELARDMSDQSRWQRLRIVERPAALAHHAKLQREAKPVVRTPPLLDQGEIGKVEACEAQKAFLIVWKVPERLAIDGGQ